MVEERTQGFLKVTMRLIRIRESSNKAAKNATQVPASSAGEKSQEINLDTPFLRGEVSTLSDFRNIL